MSATTSISEKLAEALRAYVTTVDHGKRLVNPEEWESHLDWAKLERDAKAALNQYETAEVAGARWEMRVVVISSEHVSYDTFTDYLAVQADSSETWVRTYGTDNEGYMLYTHEHIDEIPEHTPPELANVLCWAMNRGYTHVRLDQDGETVAELPSFDW